jgi:acyl transferase domain-containing protein
MLVVKHIDDAIRDGDPIRAVIRGSGINSDGRVCAILFHFQPSLPPGTRLIQANAILQTAGITLPNGEAQEQLIRRTYQLAGLDFADTQYIEFHGTGTKAGDPIEMGAVTRTVAGKSRSTLYGGSVKTQVGHTEAAAGLAGLVKCVLAMEHGIIPPHLNFSKPNRRLRLGDCNVVLPTSPQAWPECMIRRCSVNSFGFGGTNAHVIIDEGQGYLLHRSNDNPVTNGVSLHRPPVHGSLCAEGIPAVNETFTVNGTPAVDGTNGLTSSDKTESARVFVLSAPDHDTLTRQRQSYAGYLAAKGSNRILDDLSYTLCKRRSIFQWRHAVTATSIDDLERRWRDDSSQAVSAKPKHRVLFVFTGQGAQWYAMGRELIKYDVYNSSIRESAAYLKGLGCPWDALDELMSAEESSNVYLPEYSQPLCTILQIALVDLLAHLGIHPSAVVGHSSGEIAGAYAADALAKGDCLRIAYYRGVVSKKAHAQFPRGGMMAVGLSPESVQPYLSESKDLVSIGCVNSTSSITLTGDRTALLALKGKLDAEQIFCRLLAVENAYHSMQMRGVSEEYRKCIGDFTPQSPTTPIAYYSTVYGKMICSSQLGPDYWVQNLYKPVEFVAALDDIIFADAGKQWLKSEDMLPSIMLEIGPHSALGGPIKQVKMARGVLQGMEYYSVLSRGSDASHTFAATIGSLWMHGVALDLDKVNYLSSIERVV